LQSFKNKYIIIYIKTKKDKKMYNKVIMMGNLTRDIELKYIPSGAAIAKGAIATSHKYKAQDGSQKEEVCFLDFNVFGKSAEILNQYVRKGSKVMLEGRLVLEQWTANDGTNRNKHSLRVDNFKFLDSKADSQNMGGGNYQPQGGYNQQQEQQSYDGQPSHNQQNIPEVDIDTEDIPF
jgi:single-strand DNA-binding protein